MFAADSSSPFLHHLFDVIDVNRDQSLNFSEFLRAISTFCCYHEVQMVQFAFDTFDTDGSGEIGVKELSEFIGKLESRTGDIPKTVKRVLSMFDTNDDHSIGLDEFAEMNLKYPHLLWPAFRLQYRVQEVTLGLSQWKDAQRRVKGKKDDEMGRGAVATRRGFCGLCSCLADPPPPPPPQSAHGGESSMSKSSARRDPSRKLNPDRLRRKDSKGAKKLSVLKSKKSGVHSRSQQSAEVSVSTRPTTSHQPSVRLRRADTHTGTGAHRPAKEGSGSRSAKVTSGGQRLSSLMKGMSASRSKDDGDGDEEEGVREETSDAVRNESLGSELDEPVRIVHKRVAAHAATFLTGRGSAPVHPVGAEQGNVAVLRATKTYSSTPPASGRAKLVMREAASGSITASSVSGSPDSKGG